MFTVSDSYLGNTNLSGKKNYILIFTNLYQNVFLSVKIGSQPQYYQQLGEKGNHRFFLMLQLLHISQIIVNCYLCSKITRIKILLFILVLYLKKQEGSSGNLV